MLEKCCLVSSAIPPLVPQIPFLSAYTSVESHNKGQGREFRSEQILWPEAPIRIISSRTTFSSLLTNLPSVQTQAQMPFTPQVHP